MLTEGIESLVNQSVCPSQGYSWTVKCGSDLIGSGWSPKAIQTRQPHFSEHLKSLWSASSLKSCRLKNLLVLTAPGNESASEALCISTVQG